MLKQSGWNHTVLPLTSMLLMMMVVTVSAIHKPFERESCQSLQSLSGCVTGLIPLLGFASNT